MYVEVHMHVCVEARGQPGFSSNCVHLLGDEASSWPEAYQLRLGSISPVLDYTPGHTSF